MALDLGRDVRDVAKFSRHKDVRTLLIYDDSRKDVGGDIAKMLARSFDLEETDIQVLQWHQLH